MIWGYIFMAILGLIVGGCVLFVYNNYKSIPQQEEALRKEWVKTLWLSTSKENPYIHYIRNNKILLYVTASTCKDVLDNIITIFEVHINNEVVAQVISLPAHVTSIVEEAYDPDEIWGFVNFVYEHVLEDQLSSLASKSIFDTKE